MRLRSTFVSIALMALTMKASKADYITWDDDNSGYDYYDYSAPSNNYVNYDYQPQDYPSNYDSNSYTIYEVPSSYY